ncbi:P-loop containing nucleoside triphosphate hydrolase protein [Dipodascopsis tothii]|uniref:P-loop containing nucleoside triphosphate hydrolase protein n=1 Tax=Dipodascopsis tothii TaxID=44089 RepID=UPI0034CD7EF0
MADSTTSPAAATAVPAIEVSDLTYAFPDQTIGLSNISFSIPQRSRVLLVGSNGAGKSTLLRIVAGKTLSKRGHVRVGGFDPFRAGVEGITYLGTEWVVNPIVRQDMPVPLLLSSVGGDAYADRRDELIDILDIDLRWRMHAVSDGERRRVQLAMGLLRPWKTLLLDEVTVDLDVLVRARLLDFLRRETEARDCAIVYATHIFDGLADWPTHLCHIHMGAVLSMRPVTEEPELEEVRASGSSSNSALLQLALKWLTADLADRGRRDSVVKVKWSDVAPEALTGGLTKFDEYFKFSRAR